jgi:hypothetical protein
MKKWYLLPLLVLTVPYYIYSTYFFVRVWIDDKGGLRELLQALDRLQTMENVYWHGWHAAFIVFFVITVIHAIRRFRPFSNDLPDTPM